MCVSHYGYEPRFLIRETEERLKGVRFADNPAPWRFAPALPGAVAAWLKALADDVRRLARLRGAST